MYRYAEIFFVLFKYWAITLMGNMIQLSICNKWLQDFYLNYVNECKMIIAMTSMALVIPFMWREFTEEIHKIPNLKRKRVHFEISYLITFFFGILTSLLYNILFSYMDTSKMSQEYQEAVTIQYAAPFWLAFLSYVIVAPMVEEMVFRGLLFNKMRAWMKQSWAILITSTLFGIMHGNLEQFLYGFMMSIVITYCYGKIHKFAIPLLFHSGANFVAISTTYNVTFANWVSQWWISIIVGLLVIGCSVFFIRTGENKI